MKKVLRVLVCAAVLGLGACGDDGGDEAAPPEDAGEQAGTQTKAGGGKCYTPEAKGNPLCPTEVIDEYKKATANPKQPSTCKSAYQPGTQFQPGEPYYDCTVSGVRYSVYYVYRKPPGAR